MNTFPLIKCANIQKKTTKESSHVRLTGLNLVKGGVFSEFSKSSYLNNCVLAQFETNQAIRWIHRSLKPPKTCLNVSQLWSSLGFKWLRIWLKLKKLFRQACEGATTHILSTRAARDLHGRSYHVDVRLRPPSRWTSMKPPIFSPNSAVGKSCTLWFTPCPSIKNVLVWW